MSIDIDVPMIVQCEQFIYSVLLGVILGVLYFILRSLGRHGAAFLLDLIFVIAALGSGTMFFLIVCKGYPRVFHLLGLALGAALVYTLLGKTRLARRFRRSLNEKEKTAFDP